MKRFLIRLAVWSVGAFVLALCIDVMITIGLRKTDIRKYAVWNDIYKGNINSDLLVLGSSRAWCSYNTYILDSMLNCNSYNLGIDGHPIDMQVLRYHTYKRFNAPPKYIILNVDYLSTLDNSADSQYEREQFFPYIYDSKLIDQVAANKHISLSDRLIPLYRYFGYRLEIENGILSFLGKKGFTDGGMYKGFRSNDFNWERGEILDKDTTINVTINAAAVETLQAFTEEVISDSIKLVFVKSPIYYPLNGRFKSVSVTDSVFSRIASTYKIPIIDFYSSNISIDSTCFYNPSHLNSKGAKLFTMELCADLRSNGIIQ